ncbi:hypothetical protein [Rhizobium wuzhouense]|uniref:DUF2336 domain-containing protein n=1 Tax=Rhizobium wuzhouense TaxID=1986026 RepID=A0ABX5NTG9_9HYPH|nr:hypothetical protein [Rhizobium wuzhouense]PYB72267.1 hypothetical protein DMY87_13995 [Rhizobium wuzhouense]
MNDESQRLEDILIALMDKEDLVDDDIVAMIELHPKHREEILQFYEDWLTADDGRDGPRHDSGYVPDISHLWTPTGESRIENPFEHLSPTDLKKIVKRCGLSLSLMTSLEERAIRASTIPLLLVRQLAREAKSTVRDILRFLDQDQTTLASDFRSDHAPVKREKISFSEAIESSSLSEDAKDHWRKFSE